MYRTKKHPWTHPNSSCHSQFSLGFTSHSGGTGLYWIWPNSWRLNHSTILSKCLGTMIYNGVLQLLGGMKSTTASASCKPQLDIVRLLTGFRNLNKLLAVIIAPSNDILLASSLVWYLFNSLWLYVHSWIFGILHRCMFNEQGLEKLDAALSSFHVHKDAVNSFSSTRWLNLQGHHSWCRACH